jgi:MFS family permease
MKPITRYLEKAHPVVFNAFVIVAAFGLYTSMYGFRKPFTAITFENEAAIFNIDYKILLVIAQVVGYTISKFYGIKFISEVLKTSRGKSIIVLIALAELALLLFGWIENPYLRIGFLFLNGLPLGMIWGLVFNYLEGRKYTDLLGAGLSVSFIFASGFVKTIGKSLTQHFHIADFWMPFWVGIIFLLPLLFFVWMLEQVPPPTAEDIALRTERKPMFQKDRADFMKKYFPAVLLSTFIYVALTIIRSIRDDFAADIWQSMGMGNDASLFTRSETPVAVIILFMVGIMFLIKNNRVALMLNLGLVTTGLFVVVISTIMFNKGAMAPLTWMIAVGTGLYMGYVPFNCIIFERMIAAFRYSGTAGFLIYVADAWGYLGSVGVMIYKNFFSSEVDWKTVFSNYCIYLGAIAFAFSIFTFIYFAVKIPRSKPASEPAALA